MTAAGPVARCRSCGAFLPVPSPYGPPAAAWAQVSCPRCGRRPDGRRWVAHPPGGPAVPGQTGPPTEPLPRVPRDGGSPPDAGRPPYPGPEPTHAGSTGPQADRRPLPPGPRASIDPAVRPHPRWGLPTIAWTPPRTTGPAAPHPRPVLTAATLLLSTVAVLAVLSAAAETWRFVLLLQGRTAVLPAGVVATSDVLVAVAGLFTPVVTVAAVVVTVLALLRTTAWAAERAGLRPPRTPTGQLLRLLVPGWNAYGAGQVVIETHALLLAPPATADGPDPIDRSPAVRRRDRRVIGAWWCAWIVNLGLLLITLARGLGGSLQAIADTVELHIALDLAAAVTAALGAVALSRFRRLTDVRPAARSRWIVQRPVPTRGRADAVAGAPDADADAPAATIPDPGNGPAQGGSDDGRKATDPSATVSA